MEFRALYDNFKMYFDHKKLFKKNNKKKTNQLGTNKKNHAMRLLCLANDVWVVFFLSMQQDN